MNRTPDLASTTWRKSSYSDGGPNNCLEVAVGFADVVPVRDSKNPAGPVLIMANHAWTAFVHGVRRTGQ
ncbi:DUF397 domain-containing protein [Streptomyces sp. NRRL WC-3549]|uniref:DUF397 domain-containing protein n=1 Tax=Streptomyces sp. NRRL WC-3549 TaxID=1463925 RepID=UPI0004CB540B|nr:DUF397 domain-containing protein [Streptomyces sp. NRRL WC-3549]